MYSTGQADAAQRSKESTQQFKPTYLLLEGQADHQKSRLKSEFSAHSGEREDRNQNYAGTNYDAKMNERCLSLDLENLHELLGSSSEWINIQQTTKTSIRYLLNISVQ